LEAYCAEREENFYLLDVYSVVGYTDKVWSKSPAADNVALAGGWLADSPLWQNKVKQWENADGATALTDREDVLYIAKPERDLSWLEQFLQTGQPGGRLKQVDLISQSGEKVFTVYRFTLNE
jgi:hypothetical protein